MIALQGFINRIFGVDIGVLVILPIEGRMDNCFDFINADVFAVAKMSMAISPCTTKVFQDTCSKLTT